MGNENSMISSEDVTTQGNNYNRSEIDVGRIHNHTHKKKKRDDIEIVNNVDENNPNSIKMENKPMPPVDVLLQMFELFMVKNKYNQILLLFFSFYFILFYSILFLFFIFLFFIFIFIFI